VAAQAQAALLDPILAAISEYLCQAAGLRHAATIVEAHIRYLKQTKLRQGLAGMMKRPLGRKPLPPEAEAAYQEWLAARRAGREISAPELAQRYLGPEHEANPEAAVRKMRRWLQRARVYYGDAD